MEEMKAEPLDHHSFILQHLLPALCSGTGRGWPEDRVVSVFTCSQTRGTAEPVILRAQGLWELRGGAIKPEGALRLRGQMTLLHCPL